MRAAVMRERKIAVRELAAPVPLSGQVLVRTLACGICGSDLHALHHLEELTESGLSGPLREDQDIVMGHEYCAEIVEYGPDCERTLPVGTRVCAFPFVFGPQGRETVGYSAVTPGGYGEYMLLMECLLQPVPEGLPTPIAALTEPMAVGWHAVQKAGLQGGEVPLVIGCGPVGLAVIAALRRSGAGPIVAADFSPARRALAETMGADAVVDPAVTSPYATWHEFARLDAPPEAAKHSPIPLLGPFTRPALVFECVGVPGMIDAIASAEMPRGTRVVVVGVCMQSDVIRPIQAIRRELSLQFVLGYAPSEFALSLQHLAEGDLPVEAMLTGTVGLDGVAGAFEALATPERHCKIIVDPAA